MNRSRASCLEILESRVLLSAIPGLIGLPTVSIAETREGSELNGSTTGEGLFTVSRTGAADTTAITVNYTVDSASTAVAGVNYTALSGSVLIPAGKPSATIAVQVLFDPTDLGTDTLKLDLATGSGYTVSATPSKQAATMTIASDAPTVSIAETKNASTINGTTTGAGVFTVTRVGPNLTQALTVDYTVDGTSTAIAGTTYEALSGSVVIPAGMPSATISVLVNPPVLSSLTSETVVVSLVAGPTYHLNTSPSHLTATVTISNTLAANYLALLGFNAPGSSWHYTVNGQVDGKSGVASGSANTSEISSSTWRWQSVVTAHSLQLTDTAYAWSTANDGGAILDSAFQSVFADTVTLTFQNLEVCGPILAGSITQTAPVTVTTDLASGSATGTAQETTALVGESKVTAPGGTFNAIEFTEDYSYSVTGANFSAHGTQSLTVFAVSGIGIVKYIAAANNVVTPTKHSSITSDYNATAELLNGWNYVTP